VRHSEGFQDGNTPYLKRCLYCKVVVRQNADRRRFERMALELDVSKTEDIAVVRCRGRIVFGEEADELRRVVLDLLDQTKRIVLNLSWVGYIDSSGIGVLVASFISARHRGAEIKFADLSPRARQVLTNTNVERLFRIYDSTDEAVKSFQTAPEAATG
jgi:anti-sigma B factor antagonist